MRLDIIPTFLLVVLSIFGHGRYSCVNGQGGTEWSNNDGGVEEDKDYFNHWVAEIAGGREKAEEVAGQNGFVVQSQLVSLPDHYMLTHSEVPHRSKRSAHHHTKRLTEDRRITFAEQQHEKRREKRGHKYNRALANNIARSTGDLNDPNYEDQWYFEDGGNNIGRMDMGIKQAWRLGVTGRNVKVTIIDDGLERTHPDLAANYEPSASYDFNDNDEDPMPRYDITNENKHGTRCAGEIAMVANNNLCGVGVAFNARIGGLRILDGKVTDHVEGDSIGFAKNVDISSASWGPSDNGATLEGPGKVGNRGFNESITMGRGGLGTILVWAAGNGASQGDNCNCDGYTSDYRTLSVSSASQHGLSPWYSEKCASTMAATYSSGNHGDKKVISADLHERCTTEHSGTSAAAPMAAGILALVLETRPDLTWRDVQHLVALTSRPEPLAKEKGWYRNAVGLCVNHAFGFGLMDAHHLVKTARRWENVPKQHICRVATQQTDFPKEITSGNSVEVEIDTDGCRGQDQEVNYLEHIQVVITMETSKRGNMYIEVESPAGTITPVMLERANDKSTKGFQQWPLTSVHTWGENASGIWKVRVADRQSGDSQKAVLKEIELVLFGTREKPFYHDMLGDTKCPSMEKFPVMIKQKVEPNLWSRMQHLFDGMN